jgi:hypothetical protein
VPAVGGEDTERDREREREQRTRSADANGITQRDFITAHINQLRQTHKHPQMKRVGKMKYPLRKRGNIHWVHRSLIRTAHHTRHVSVDASNIRTSSKRKPTNETDNKTKFHSKPYPRTRTPSRLAA